MVCLDGGPVDRALLRRMAEAMGERGPDGTHVWSAGSVGLGHARFRTTDDIDSVDHPFSLDGEVWITADARVDRRDDLVRGLRAHDRDVSIRCEDGELILHAYHAWGPNCVERLIGDFAFAIWDGRRRQLMCARDHFGATPFFFARTGSTVVFGNTLDTLRLHPDLPDELNEQVIADLIVFLHNRDVGATIYTSLQCLPPAHRLIINDRVHLERYWGPEGDREYLHYRRPEEYVDHFRAVFTEAVADRVRSARISAELSGGMDSSGIVATVCRLNGQKTCRTDLQAYTVALRSLVPESDGRLAVSIARRLGVTHDLLYAEDYHDEPAGSPPFVPPEPAPLMLPGVMRELLGRAAAHGPVLLSGLGGDPLLAPGPYRWNRLPREGRWRAFFADVRNQVSVHGARRPPLHLRGVLRRWQRRPDPSWAAIPDWLDPDLIDRVGLLDRKRTLDEMDAQRHHRRGMVEYSYWSTLMTWRDPAYSGLRVRMGYPFFDRRLFDLMSSMPPVPWCQQKAVLRLALGEALPNEVLRRPKTPLTWDTNLSHTRALEGGGPLANHRRLAEGPALAAFVDRARLGALIEAPDHTDSAGWRHVEAATLLAHWLDHRRAP